MLRVGLTGGIGSGKSMVAEMLRECGVPVLEADTVAHQAIAKGAPAYREIVSAFGPGILQPDGEIDHQGLAAIVFSSPAKLRRLNRIVHPRVLKRMTEWLGQKERAGSSVAVVEAPLLIEAGYHRKLDRLVVVWCRPARQRARLVKRGMSAAEAARRMKAQMPPAQKRRLADDAVDNSGTRAETRRQVAALAKRLKSLAGAAGRAEKRKKRT